MNTILTDCERDFLQAEWEKHNEKELGKKVFTANTLPYKCAVPYLENYSSSLCLLLYVEHFSCNPDVGILN